MGLNNVGVASLSNFSKCPTFEIPDMMREVVNYVFISKTFGSKILFLIKILQGLRTEQTEVFLFF